MSIPTSQRATREWLLLFIALGIVAAVVVPLWQLTTTAESRSEFFAKWTPQRVGKLLIGPEQALCYLCAVWAGLILGRRYSEVRRQRAAFHYELLPTEEGARILPEDARPLARKVDQVIDRRGPSILANMVRLGLGKYAVSKAAPDVAEVVRNQADVEASRFVATMNTVNYLAWAIPAIGFLGTVRGLASAMGLSRAKDQDSTEYLEKYLGQVTDHLGTAFDCTFVALALSLVLMYAVHAVQRSEETLVIDCQDYCQEHLLLRLYDPQPADGGLVPLR
jgi:biopolymer transport protein ExbB/TolQ